MKYGISVTCTTCDLPKAPHGRSVSPYTAAGYCMSGDCDGYDKEPLPGCLWPGESGEDFGYPHCDNAAEERP